MSRTIRAEKFRNPEDRPDPKARVNQPDWYQEALADTYGGSMFLDPKAEPITFVPVDWDDVEPEPVDPEPWF